MLKTRIITAAFIAVVAFGVLFFTPPAGFRLMLTALLLAGSWEFARLAGFGRVGTTVLLVLQAALFAFMEFSLDGLLLHPLALLVAAVLCWCVMFLRLLTFRPDAGATLNYRGISFFSALASISFAWFALVWLRHQAHGEFLILVLLFTIWAADIGAYFSGRAFGRHKLAPSISPGKTREGLLGGVVLAVAVALLLARMTQTLPSPAAWFAVCLVITVLASAGGDLFISIHKRTVGLKDSGKIFPGHGGVLDRFDSLLSGAPVFALGYLLLTG